MQNSQNAQQTGQTAPQQPAPEYLVYGIPIDDEEVAGLTKTVMNISIAMALIAVASFIIQILYGGVYGTWLIVAVAIPVCGYFAARNRDAGLLQCFWGCNCCCVIFYFLSLGLVFGVQLEYLECLCDDVCRADNLADDETSPQDRQDTCSSLDSIRIAYIVWAVSAGVEAILHLLGAYYGAQLQAKREFFSQSQFIPTAVVLGTPGQAAAAGSDRAVAPAPAPEPAGNANTGSSNSGGSAQNGPRPTAYPAGTQV